ncbi:MAG: 13E12 repeat family protein [Propionibacteriaceae bacterium]|nr:13E12 repeat family protein [Propionibacteriaceae bacterium]
MFDSAEVVWRRKLAHKAMRRYADTRARIDKLEAQAAAELAEALHWYEWPKSLPVPDGADQLNPAMMGGIAYWEDVDEEVAAANRCSPFQARVMVAQVTTLTHRMPQCWAKVVDPHVCAPLWQARAIAGKCATLNKQQTAKVDAAVSTGLGCAQWGRLSRRVSAAVKRADPDGARKHAAHSAQDRFVRITPDTADEQSSWLLARLDTRDALLVEDTLRLLSGKLEPTTSLDKRRATALGMLANPGRAVQLLGIHTSWDGAPRTEADARQLLAAADAVAKALAPRTQLYVHVYQDSLDNPDEIARVEGLGPVLLDQLHHLTGGSAIRATQVINLAQDISTDRYEIPEQISEHVLMSHPYVQVPWGSQEARRQDKDHIKPWLLGQTRQTRPSNLIPETRGWHRAKTHAGFHIDILYPKAHLWTTAAGQQAITDQTGTHRLPPIRQ